MSSEDDDVEAAKTQTVQQVIWKEHFKDQQAGVEDEGDGVSLAGGRLPRSSASPLFAKKKPMAEHEPAKVGFLNKKMTMMVMNRMHEPALRAIAGHYGGGGVGVATAQVLDMDTEGFSCEMVGADGSKTSTRIEFIEPLGGDITAESMFIGMAKSATDALDGQMDGIASEHEMVNIRHGQLEQGSEIHTVTLNCAVIVAELENASTGEAGGQTLPHVEGKGRSHLVVRPAGSGLMLALAERIASGSLRVVLHDSSRAPTLLQRIFRRLEITPDGQTLHDLGVVCDAAQVVAICV